MTGIGKLKSVPRILWHKFRQFLRLSNAERLLLLRFGVMVPLIEVCLRTFGFKRVIGWLQPFAVAKKVVANPAATVEQYRRMLFLLHRQLPFVGRCLAGALALWCVLQRLGIETELRFGSRKQDGRLYAHAWLEYESQPLTLNPEVGQYYAAFAEPIVPAAVAAS